MKNKKYESKKGRIKDYLKGIISLAVGGVLIIIGVACFEILPLAIVMWVLGFPAVATGLGLIIHNKKNNTHYVSDSPSSDSSSSGSSESSMDWEYKFKSALEDTRIHETVYSCYATTNNGVIELTVSFWTYDDNAYDGCVRDIRNAYKKVAAKCPYSSKLLLERQ